MKNNLFNAIAIFFSILGSFAVERFIQDINEKEQLQTLESNLLYELEQNYYSLLSLRGKLKSVISVSDSVTANWSTFNAAKVKSFHQDNLYDVNNRIEFILSRSFSFSPKNMYFNSLTNSGLILKIKRKELRNEIESVGSLINQNYYGSHQGISNDVMDWFKSKSKIERTLNNDIVFNKYKDFNLLQLLTIRRRNEIYKLYGVDNDIKFLKKLIEEVKSKGLF